MLDVAQGVSDSARNKAGCFAKLMLQEWLTAGRPTNRGVRKGLLRRWHSGRDMSDKEEPVL